MTRTGKTRTLHLPFTHLLTIVLFSLSLLEASDPGGQRHSQQTTAQGEPKWMGNTMAASSCAQPETGNPGENPRLYLCPLSWSWPGRTLPLP